MFSADLISVGKWLEGMEPVLPMVAGFVSAVILFGCAIASWLAPSEKKDQLFHHHVM
jgi:hypothetical protein